MSEELEQEPKCTPWSGALGSGDERKSASFNRSLTTVDGAAKGGCVDLGKGFWKERAWHVGGGLTAE